MNKQDAAILGAVYACLLQRGAASTERIVFDTKLDSRQVQWALFQLRTTEHAGLNILPDTMLPSGWDIEVAS